MAARAANPTKRPRRAIAVVSAVVILAFSVGGALALARVAQTTGVRAGLQWEADQAALAYAAALGRQSATAGPSMPATAGQAILGRWDPGRRRFVAATSEPNAVKVIVRGPESPGGYGGGWFSPVISPSSAGATTSAVAAILPRDIVFVVDLRSAMAAESLAAAERLLEVRQAGDLAASDAAKLRDLYHDLGYESFPGPDEPLGAPWGASGGGVAWNALTAPDGPLSSASIPAEYRIVPGDPISVRREKACRAVIDGQILRLMPKAMPDPHRPESREYWAAYLDDLAQSSGGNASVGYASYVRFMLRRGRNEQVHNEYVPLSQHSADCPWHLEQVARMPLRFPPRVEPMHQVRWALAEAIGSLEERNRRLGDPALRDRVAIVSFDCPAGGARVQQDLTSDYSSAIRVCARLQAVGLRGPASQAQSGLELANQVLHQTSPSADLERRAQKIVVLVTAARPDAARTGLSLETQVPLPDRVVCIREGDAQVRAALDSIVNATTVALVR